MVANMAYDEATVQTERSAQVLRSTNSSGIGWAELRPIRQVDGISAETLPYIFDQLMRDSRNHVRPTHLISEPALDSYPMARKAPCRMVVNKIKDVWNWHVEPRREKHTGVDHDLDSILLDQPIELTGIVPGGDGSTMVKSGTSDDVHAVLVLHANPPENIAGLRPDPIAQPGRSILMGAPSETEHLVKPSKLSGQLPPSDPGT